MNEGILDLEQEIKGVYSATAGWWLIAAILISGLDCITFLFDLFLVLAGRDRPFFMNDVYYDFKSIVHIVVIVSPALVLLIFKEKLITTLLLTFYGLGQIVMMFFCSGKI